MGRGWGCVSGLDWGRARMWIGVGTAAEVRAEV